MSLEAFLDSQTRSVNDTRVNLSAISSHCSIKSIEDLDSVLDVMNTEFLEKKGEANSTSSFVAGHEAAVAVANLITPNGAYLQSYRNTNMETYLSQLSSPMLYSSNNLGIASSADHAFSQGGHKEGKKQEFRHTTNPTDLYKPKPHTCTDSLPVKIKKEPDTLTPVPKKPRLDPNQGCIQQQQISRELLMKASQDSNPHQKALAEQHTQQNQLQQSILHSSAQIGAFHQQLPKQLLGKQTNLLKDQCSEHRTFMPLLDGDICFRRFMQYTYHLRNRSRDNDIGSWRKFVSEYFAPGSKKSWCFSTYENIELLAPSVFCPKSVDTWCCDICGSRTGKGLESTFETFPLLFKLKYESGMLDEFLFLDLPQVRTFPFGLALEYGKVIQESVYEKFRIVHEGKLRIIFGNDLKILSWQFCAHNHEEYLLHRLVSPQINQLVMAAQKYQNIIQNGASHRVSSEDLRANFNSFASAGNQLARNVQLPQMNDLGYPKQFVRCLQIAEIFSTLKDLMSLSLDTKMGPIESLSKYSQAMQFNNRMDKQGTQPHTGAQHQHTSPESPDPGFHVSSQRITEKNLPSRSGNSSSTLSNSIRKPIGKNSATETSQRNRQQGFLVHSNHTSSYTRSVAPNIQNVPRAYTLAMAENSTNPHQVLVDKLLREMAAASGVNNAQNTYGILSNGAIHKSNKKLETSNQLRAGESSNAAAAAQVNMADASKTSGPAKVHSRENVVQVIQARRNVSVKAEPYLPEQLPEDFQSSTTGFCKFEDFDW